MEIVIIAFTALFASLLTFFSGFGLGTILTPVFIIYFPVDLAIAMTGIVHLSNNLFKISLIGKNINYKVLLKFGLPAIGGAFVGAFALKYISENQTSLFKYHVLSYQLEVYPMQLIIALLMIFFSLFELIPRLKKIQLDKKALIFGGLLSGFFGGLSGHQGALRSVFLLKVGLSKESYIATGVAIACLVDFTRIPLYFTSLSIQDVLSENIEIFIWAISAAFIGAIAGKKLLTKITIDSIQYIVGIMIILLAIALGSGIIQH